MTYYEELGVSPTATTEEIKRAYRQISKLFHPDIQTDDNVRQVAEIQQKRLNAIVAVLTNPDERRLYDQSLQPPEAPPAPAPAPAGLDAFMPPPRPSDFRSGRRQNYLWLGLFAIPVVGSALFWWTTERNIVGVPIAGLSDRTIETPASEPDAATSTTPARTTPPATPPPVDSNGAANATKDFLPPPAPMIPPGSRNNAGQATQRSTASAPATPAAPSATPSPSTARVATATPVPPSPAHEPPASTAPQVSTPSPAGAPNLPAPPHIAPSNSVPQPDKSVAAQMHVETAAAVKPPESASAANQGLSGMWIYIPATNGKSNNRAIYPPEFIELSLQDARGHVQGSYRSRYRIVDRPVSPDVNFQFRGSDNGPQQFNWKTADGTRGQIRLQPLTANTLQVDWFVTQFGRSPGLASGSAVLTRRP